MAILDRQVPVIWFRMNKLMGRGAVGVNEIIKDERMTWSVCIDAKVTDIITDDPIRLARMSGLELVDD